MKRKTNPLFFGYLIVVFLPIALVITFFTALFTIIFIMLVGDKKLSYYPAILWSRWICALTFQKVTVKGTENYDPNKSYIFIANHQSIFDIFLVYGWLNSRFKWIMKKELRKIPLVGKACEMAGHIFIDRSNAVQAKKSIEKAEASLRHGASVVLFPEGRRTRTGELQPFKRGAFFLALNLNLEVVPITIIGAYESWPSDTIFINPGRLEMIIHKPLSTKDLTHDNLNDFIEKSRTIIEAPLLQKKV
ncbi:MAG TPA: lysophospholipid acyltransferase family protein [Paludibacteraceae bacterium]|nr:lysophospholipid acyltransferase family protein [Paludibacteraceae bacterium]HOS36782.1 lysophospholipid acyltransferase family protein [Paludibacteraceae bacterium]HPH72894.1 lysophospholipid acyltransferase family protein [Paludibacteraceae bacterium]HPK19673.1 lysophospholipid acyltransferase family protein [Paludibacteraceae bacterium]HPO47527.1 lysophospholipid acyltransferase family protein [Paludibacteraceae bacterium]